MEFSSWVLVLQLVHSSNLTLTSLTCFWSDCHMSMKAQYRWVAKYPDSPSEKSSWMDKRQDVISDFTEYIQNEELLRLPLPGTTVDPIKPDSNQDPVYYLDKRLFMDGDVNNADSFFIYTMKKKDWRQFQWKVKCQWNVFSLANDPAWTLNKGP